MKFLIINLNDLKKFSRHGHIRRRRGLQPLDNFERTNIRTMMWYFDRGLGRGGSDSSS